MSSLPSSSGTLPESRWGKPRVHDFSTQRVARALTGRWRRHTNTAAKACWCQPFLLALEHCWNRVGASRGFTISVHKGGHEQNFPLFFARANVNTRSSVISAEELEADQRFHEGTPHTGHRFRVTLICNEPLTTPSQTREEIRRILGIKTGRYPLGLSPLMHGCTPVCLCCARVAMAGRQRAMAGRQRAAGMAGRQRAMAGRQRDIASRGPQN